MSLTVSTPLGFKEKIYTLRKELAGGKKRIIVFGAGKTSRKAIPKLMKDYEIIGIADNDNAKWGHCFNGIEIYSPKKISALNYDYIVIVSIFWKEILKQLGEEKDIDECKIYFEKGDDGYSLRTSYAGTFYRNIINKNENGFTVCRRRSLGKVNNILFLAYYFPPMGSSPIQRTLKFVKYLSQMGYLITVVTTDDTSTDMDYSLEKEVPKTVKVIRVSECVYEKIFTPREDRKRVFDFISRFSNDDDFYDEWMDAEDSQMEYILTDWTIKWAVKCFHEIEKYIDIDSIDAIYSTAPYWSPHLLGYALKKQYGIPWVADYRDPWLSDEMYAKSVYSFMTKAEMKWYRHFEGILVAGMDRIIVAGESWIKGFIETYNVDERIIECITNGYDEDDFKDIVRSNKKNEALTLCYNGLLGYNRRPQYLLEVISELIDEGLIKRGNICWYFNGDIDYHYEDYIKPYDKYGVVKRNGFLSHRESLRVAINSDVMVMYGEIGDMAAMNYPGKFYEYLRLGLPILCFSGKDSPQEKILQETGLGENIALDDKDSIRKYILSRYEIWKKTERQLCMSNEAIRKYERKNLTKRLAAVFESLRTG